ncbi:P-loop containing nucleoside triphosphate hydrolase protein [Diplogelasinospora grovesii]|uniref:RNA helicase n=1 Tax=Diplogelasinospora grovesii TaxID=303347 RepID=A0AAN6NIW5_9PEZI|nr:P-loop containing nucleoside triphosphate hydrolase protein [Diplogelasinospora grovesii]
MDDLAELELAGLVSKVAAELRNHLGIENTTLAEFLIAKRLECDTSESFTIAMTQEMGDVFNASVIDSIDRLVRTMHPAMKAKTAAGQDEPDKQRSVEKRAQGLSSLSMPDTVPVHDSIDDTLAVLEALQPKSRKAESGARKWDHSRSRSRSPERRKRRSPDRDGDRSRRYDEDEYDGSRIRRQRREEEGQQRLRRPPREVDDAPVLHKIYDGHVTGIKDFGAFVNLDGMKGKVGGLVHVSRLAEGRVNHPSDLIQRGQPVKVKVISIDGTRVGLSMKDVDQQTGQDLAPQARLGTGANVQALGRHTEGGSQEPEPVKRQKKRMTSPERWEIRQLIAAGVAKASDYPDLEDDYNATLRGDGDGKMELEVDVDIEVREEEPPFLVGQTKQSLELSPIRVVKAPGGSLNRAAMSGAALAKERKELKRQEADAVADADADEETKIDLSAQWNDPMADLDKRKFASDLRSAKLNTTESLPDWKRAVQPKDQSYGKRTDMSIKQQRETLPVFAFRSQLIEAVRQNQILIVVGETGSGKTTQMTQYLAEAGFTNSGGIIGCTQPRRVAAMSVAKRVAEEVGCKLGEEVGYSVRFDDCTSLSTKIKYMTDGLLQREILLDPDLKRYSLIMLDEAHERTIATDVLFALLKKTLKKRSDLKVIVTSATLDADKFSSYFNGAPIFTIPGRTFPVEILYSREPESDYLDAALTTVMQIHLTEPAGDILVFLTGQEEIDTSCEVLYERMKAVGSNVPELIILPVYSALPTEMQSRIFDPMPPGSRKVVIATNIAETSITIDNVYYVVDPGFVKQKAYDPKLGMDSLIVTPISQAQANQRAGRAGRTGPGKCFRLYTEAAYQTEMLPTPIPDIQRQNISMTILMLKAMGIDDLLHFDFMDPPPVNTMLTALEELYALGALDDEGLLTRLGRKMADFPMEPTLAKVLIASAELSCSDEMLSIVAMLNLANVFYRPKEKQAQADQKKAKFHDPHGDHLTLLNVYNAWKQSGYSSPWCFENFIQARSMRQAKDVREQLVQIMERYRQPVVSCGRKTEQVRKALCAGFFRNAARKDSEAGTGAGSYKTLLEGTPIYLHPSSALFGKHAAEWVVYHELVLTTREYMRWTTSIEPKWLVEAAPTFFKVAGTGGTMSKRRKQERIQPLYNKNVGENDWRISAQRRPGRSGGGGTWG